MLSSTDYTLLDDDRITAQLASRLCIFFTALVFDMALELIELTVYTTSIPGCWTTLKKQLTFLMVLDVSEWFGCVTNGQRG